MKRQIIRIKLDIDELIIEFTDLTGETVLYTLFIEDAQAFRHGGFPVSGYNAKISHDKLKRLHLRNKAIKEGKILPPSSDVKIPQHIRHLFKEKQ